MPIIDWAILISTLLAIVSYGLYKSRKTNSVNSFLLADKQLPWYHVGLSVMATQASAITFLSAPGQAYTDGMRFVQFYFGLPLATIVLCTSFVPIFKKLNVFTAYEYLEKRFDLKTRSLTAFLFLIQRGLSTGITIYAPAIILSVILNVSITYTILLNGCLVILYTVYGGTKAVSYTQLFQMLVIFSGLILAGFMVVSLLPPNIRFTDAIHIADNYGKMNTIDTSFDLKNRYNIWSGIIGGFFLQLSYFGTDQSQVGRYLTGKNTKESVQGLIMNGIVKIPMQYGILLIGILVFTFYQFNQAPVFFNDNEINKLKNSTYSAEYESLSKKFETESQVKIDWQNKLSLATEQNNEADKAKFKAALMASQKACESTRSEVKQLMLKNNPKADTNDTNYIFLNFVTHYLPTGVVGLLIAIILLASMGSTASGLNSLASTTLIDIYKRLINKDADDATYLTFTRWATVAWGLFCITVALYASKLGNLIEAVNILGSLFYGTILGIFLIAFFIKWINGTTVFVAAVIAELLVIAVWYIDVMAFLWLNVVGCLLVMGIAMLLHNVFKTKPVVQATANTKAFQ